MKPRLLDQIGRFERPTPLERWASRDPDLRWALVFVALLFLWGLAGSLDSPPERSEPDSSVACLRPAHVTVQLEGSAAPCPLTTSSR